MKKNSSFVNLFLEESTGPASEGTAEWHLEANGIIIYQATATGYSEETRT